MSKWLGQTETCDICGGKLRIFGELGNRYWFVDGRTIKGPWALMCISCFEAFGVGLGLGCGQKYDGDTFEKIEG